MTRALLLAIVVAAVPGTARADAPVAPDGPTVRLGGYLRPEAIVAYAPEAAERDRLAYGLGTSRAGLIVEATPLPSIEATLHLLVGGDTEDTVSEVDAVDRNGDGLPDDVDAETRAGVAFGLDDAALTWRAHAALDLGVGRRRVPLALPGLTGSTRLQLPARVPLYAWFAPGTDLGAWAAARAPGGRLTAIVGVWNGTGREADAPPDDGRGVLVGARVDATTAPLPFAEGDFTRGPLRAGVGAGVMYRDATAFDAAGGEGVQRRDLRAAVSARIAVAGLYAQVEGLRRQVTDSLSSRPSADTGVYVHASYYLLVGTVGVAPIVRAGWLRAREHAMPGTATTLEAGVAVHPRHVGGEPDRLRVTAAYVTDQDPDTGERAHRAVAQVWVGF